MASAPHHWKLDSPLTAGLAEFFRRLEKRLALNQPLAVFLAGGMAVHLYVGKRVTTDIDAEFSARVALPQDLLVSVTMADGSTEELYLDSNFNTSLGLIHEDYQQDARLLLLPGLQHIQLRVLSPVDLAVSKISRLADPDREDIYDLSYAGLASAADIESRANEALAYFVGNTHSLQLNIRDAIALARDAENAAKQSVLSAN